jgi:hypothetical protein
MVHAWESRVANQDMCGRHINAWPRLESRAGDVHGLTTEVVSLASTKVTAAGRVASVNRSWWHAWLAIWYMVIVHVNFILGRGALPLSYIATDPDSAALFGNHTAEFGAFW